MALIFVLPSCVGESICKRLIFYISNCKYVALIDKKCHAHGSARYYETIALLLFSRITETYFSFHPDKILVIRNIWFSTKEIQPMGRQTSEN